MSNDAGPSPISPELQHPIETTALLPRPHHFISRSDGALTPLIAVDELPSHVRIVGVPSVLSNAETQGMISLGVQPRSHGFYVIDTANAFHFAASDKQSSILSETPIPSPHASDVSHFAVLNQQSSVSPDTPIPIPQAFDDPDHTETNNSLEADGSLEAATYSQVDENFEAATRLQGEENLEEGPYVEYLESMGHLEDDEFLKKRNTVSAKDSAASDILERFEDHRVSEPNVEKWRQDISSVEEIQAAIDAAIETHDESVIKTESVVKAESVVEPEFAVEVESAIEAGSDIMTESGMSESGAKTESGVKNESGVEKGSTKPPRIYKPETPGIFGQKIYCTHWLRTGECDFTQQGCMYKHEMPDDATLAALNFRGVPRWYREAHGVPVPPNSFNTRPSIMDRSWRAGTKNSSGKQPEEFKPTNFSRFDSPMQTNVMQPNYTRNDHQNQQYNMTQNHPHFRSYNIGNEFSNSEGHLPLVSREYQQSQMWNTSRLHGPPPTTYLGFARQSHSGLGYQQVPYNGQRSSAPIHSAGMHGFPLPPPNNGDYTPNPSFNRSFDQMSLSEHGLSNYQPLMPSPPPPRHASTKRIQPVAQPKAPNKPTKLFEGAPPTPIPMHRRLFVAPGESQFIASSAIELNDRAETPDAASSTSGPMDKTANFQGVIDKLLKSKPGRPTRPRGRGNAGNLVDLTDK